jgi:hypothetical protein
MAKAKKKKEKRPKKYEPKLKIEGSFDEVIKVSVSPQQASNSSKQKKKD